MSELAAAIEQRRAVVIAGAGISLAATGGAPVASWRGLLLDGVERCLSLDRTLSSWADEVRAGIVSADATAMVAAAQQVETQLRSLLGNQYRKWLRDSVGGLTASQPGLLHALAALDVPIATTNYDDLLSAVVPGPPCTWRETDAIQRVVRGDDSGVIHLHGHWRDVDTVVFGVTSYAAAMEDRPSQEMLRALFATNTVIFIGFGAGLDDPNFTALRAWYRDTLAGSDYPPTLLVRDSDLALAAERYEPDGIQVLSFGADRADLEVFLADLRPSRTSDASPRRYDWPELTTLLPRLHRRVRRDFTPDLVVTMSGPGSAAAYYCLSMDPDEIPVVACVTFPRQPSPSPRNEAFRDEAQAAGWWHHQSNKWDVFVPNLVSHLPAGGRVLLLDDRVIGGNVQRALKTRLQEAGLIVRQAALVVHPDVAGEVDWYEEVTTDDFTFPWGNRAGRS